MLMNIFYIYLNLWNRRNYEFCLKCILKRITLAKVQFQYDRNQDIRRHLIVELRNLFSESERV